MTKIAIINRTIETLQKLPEDKASEIAEFAEFLLKKYEEQLLQKGIETLVGKSESFAFLNDEEDLYKVEDLKEHYK
jgi:hypothetical protein